MALFEHDAPSPDQVRDEIAALHLRRYHHLRNRPADREYVEGLWETYKRLGLADPKFVESFPTGCEARIWEMRVACTLHRWGWRLLPSPSPQHGPDFGIQTDGGHIFWVEATVPTDGVDEIGGVTNPDKVRVEHAKWLVSPEHDRTIYLRLSTAIQKKRKQRRAWIEQGLIAEDDGFLVALSGSLLSSALFEREDSPRIVRYLFGLGAPLFEVDEGGRPTGSGFESQPTASRREGAAEVWTNLFKGPHASEVTALLYGASPVEYRPEIYGHAEGGDYVFVHNPFAATPWPQVPLPRSSFPSGQVWYVTEDEQGANFLRPDFRQVSSFRTVGARRRSNGSTTFVMKSPIGPTNLQRPTSPDSPVP